jgi:lysozyme family protein
MRINFIMALNFVLHWEGYKSDDPDDPGGRTIFGISEHAHPQLVAEIWDLPKDEAREKVKPVYLNQYWVPAGCDAFSYPNDVIMFDTAVNAGIARAKAIYAKSANPTDYMMNRIAFYNSIATGAKIKFLRGWINRTLDLYMSVVRG